MAAKTKEQWASMSSEERKAYTAEALAGATKVCKEGKFPTGLKVTIGGMEYIARPARLTDSGGVTYQINARPCSVAGQPARFNKFSFTLMGEGSASVADSFEEEHLL